MEQNDTVVVLGETGSGKTTRACLLPLRNPFATRARADTFPNRLAEIPHFLFRSNTPCSAPRVCITQPRRVAATSLAIRVSAEVGCALGREVGYTVRFDDKSTPGTRLKYMTDGALLAEMLADRDLDRYDIVVLDEAHERSLRTDMLMGFLKDLQKRRKEKVARFNEERAAGKGKEKGDDTTRDPTELKIVVMSATIDAKRFSEFFSKYVMFAVFCGLFRALTVVPVAAHPSSTCKGVSTPSRSSMRPNHNQITSTRLSRRSSKFT